MSILDDKFSEERNEVFLIRDLETLERDGYEALRDFINAHDTIQVSRLTRLRQTYLGYNHGINSRERRDEELADYRATHDFAKYVTDFITGYVAGNAVAYSHDDERTNEELTQFNNVNDIESHDFNMIEDCSIYGRAYELVYRSQDDEDKVIQVSPFNAFMIYDTSLERNELAGVVYFNDVDEEGKSFRNITVYTPYERIELLEKDGEIREQDRKEHFYQSVQLNEWVNPRFRTGDFEHVLDLFDLYDIAQSDTANYMTDLNDALLKIEGDVKLDVDEAKKMKKARMMLLKPRVDAQGKTGNVNADFIYKKYDVQGSEAYKDRIKQDIHMLTYTPNLSDDNFSGVQSGESMKYKMASLEQVRAKKERHFKKALRKRYKLLGTVLNIQNRANALEKIKIDFTPNVPQVRSELVALFNSLGGTLSERTKLGLLDFVEDPDEELKAIMKEREEQTGSNQNDDEYEQSDEEQEEETEEIQ